MIETATSAHGTTFQSWQDLRMTNSKPPPARRSDALSKERIVQAAIEMLGEGGANLAMFDGAELARPGQLG